MRNGEGHARMEEVLVVICCYEKGAPGTPRTQLQGTVPYGRWYSTRMGWMEVREGKLRVRGQSMGPPRTPPRTPALLLRTKYLRKYYDCSE